MAQSSRAVVIGGGIGGLTAAAALHQRGWEVIVLERARSLEPVGSAISLSPNALRALDVLGIGDAIRGLAAWQGDAGLRTPRGRWLSRTSAEAATERFGGPLVLLHRATLIDTLAALLPPGTVRTSTDASLADPGDDGRPARVAFTEPGEGARSAGVAGAESDDDARAAGVAFTETGDDGRPAPVITADPGDSIRPGRMPLADPGDNGRSDRAAASDSGRSGRAASSDSGPSDRVPLVEPAEPGQLARVTGPVGELEADLVVAADGIRSAVRRTLFPGHPGPVYSGFTTWRVVIPLPGTEFASHETWGRGRIWGTHPLEDGRVYAYAAARTPAGGRASDDERAELVRRFGDWHDPVPAVIAATRPEDVLRHDVHHIAEPLPAFHSGRVALLGDAAHAMPPTLGQGGNQAIEDAIVLAHALSEGDVASGLAAYSAARLPRTTAITRQAVRVARLNMAANRAVMAVRNTAIAALSKASPALLLRGFAPIADWRPPYASEKASAGNR